MLVRIDANVSYLREMVSEKCKVFARKVLMILFCLDLYIDM